MSRKADREEARQSLLGALKVCGPDMGGTLVITRMFGRPSSSGITEHLDIRVWQVGEDGSPAPTMWLTRLACRALGYRFNESHETLVMGGYGYCRATQIASDLHKLCGHPLRVESLNTFAGPRGWYPEPPRAVHHEQIADDRSNEPYNPENYRE